MIKIKNRELEGVLTIKDNEGKLIAIVYNDLKKRSQVFYKTVECGVEDINNIFDKMTEDKILPPCEQSEQKVNLNIG